ncbi:MAG: Y-family DNA polymerase [Burkholderiaceae bacterium]
MRCWIAVILNRLPLQALYPRWSEPLPIAITDGAQVIALSSMATAQGVRIGMRAVSVHSIAPQVLLQPRDLLREQQSFEAVTLALMQYTPEIAAIDHQSLVMDVSASLSLFGGHRRLSRRVHHTVQTLGFSMALGMAPTAQGAWLIARHRGRQQQAHHRTQYQVSKHQNSTNQTSTHQVSTHHLLQRRTIKLDTMCRWLDGLSFTCLPEAAIHQEWLQGIGCSTLSDVRRLPRSGLKRRTRTGLLEALDRAYGEAPELFDWLEAPASFQASIELPYRIDQTPMLLFAAQRLLAQMVGWLVARQQAVRCFMFWLVHEKGRASVAPSTLEVTLSEPSCEESHLVRLVKERFGQLQLTAPVIALRLEASQLSAWIAPSGQLFASPASHAQDDQRLLELLMARLGADALRLPAPCADYRPEHANQWQTAHQASAIEHAEMPTAARPFWLLEQPLPLMVRQHRPFYGSSLRLLSGPERIEAGWWDGALALRDYFVAQGEEGACYWIYRERDAATARWFLHGLFA